ncbi:MAG: ABC-type transport auxiliary lipoprotein family protein [Rudaea sp.]
MKKLLTIFFVLALGACSPASVPDVTYFRLPPPTALPHADPPLTSLPIEVEVFRGEGIYAEQALIYSTSDNQTTLRTYHYQLWGDPPSRGLQSRLTQMLRDSGVSALVTDSLPASNQALRVQGKITRYERVQNGQTFTAHVAFDIRIEQDSGEPVLEQTYAADANAADATIAGTVAAFGAAVDQAFAKFYTDLAALGKDAHAG